MQLPNWGLCVTNEAYINGYSRFVGYRVGDTYCLSPTITLAAVTEVPQNLVQLPGTKPWVLGVMKLGRELIPYINLPQFLNLPSTEATDRQAKASPALILRDTIAAGSIALKVDEMVGFIPVGEIEDVDEPEFEIPIGLGACLCGAVRARGKVWALIDLHSLTNDEKLHKIDLN